MSKQRSRTRLQHPAIDAVLTESKRFEEPTTESDKVNAEHTTSASLARALAIGCLSRLDHDLSEVNIWDPAAGSGFAGRLLVDALQGAGVETKYRGQELNESTADVARHRFSDLPDAEIATDDTLTRDPFEDFVADLVIVDAPWGLDWKGQAPEVEARLSEGAFRFGLPQRTDATWLFVSLALEKLRLTKRGGGRVAALVAPSSLSSGGDTGAVRRKVVEAGLLESVTRLPDGLAPTTSIPLYLLTFSNASKDVARAKAMVANLQTAFTTESNRRAISTDALREIESGIRTRKTGPRNRQINTRQFTRRDIHVARTSTNGTELNWRVTTYDDTAIDNEFLTDHYGEDVEVSLVGEPRETIDLDPSPLFGDDSRELTKDLIAKGWKVRRLSGLLTRVPESSSGLEAEGEGGRLYVPISPDGDASVNLAEASTGKRTLAIDIDTHQLQPTFLAAWLNTDSGVASRQRSIDAASPSRVLRGIPTETRSLMRWADELIVPVPPPNTQIMLASSDEQLRSFRMALDAHRADVWADPDTADEVLDRISRAFDDSLDSWLESLPFPIATALWTAKAATNPGEQQRAYVHAWEAIVTFHATVLLAACRTDPVRSRDVESAIRRALEDNRLGIEKASMGTWVVIAEKTSKELRKAIDGGDDDDIARVRRAFGDLSRTAIGKLVSNEVIAKFKEISHKRNLWHGHSGYIPEHVLRTQVDSLLADLREFRGIIGNVWSQLRLVRAGSADLTRHGYTQIAEIAMGHGSPFTSEPFSVGAQMYRGELYLVKDGSQSPLPLGQFVQLRPAPSSAQFTTYFYNRVEGSNVRMVSYQYGQESELGEDALNFRDAFGFLINDAH